MTMRAPATLLLVGLALSGCGLKGALYLPEKPGEVVIRPGPSASPPAATPAEPEEPATPPEPPAAVEPSPQPPTGTDRG